MACKTTSAASRAAAGFTLPEVMLAIGLVGLVGTGLVAFSMFSARTLLAASNRLSLEAQARIALDQLTREMRNSLRVLACTNGASISLLTADGATVTFSFVPNVRELRRTQGGQTTVLLSDCDAVTFSMFGAAPESGTFDLVPVTNPQDCKAVNVRLNCSRLFIRPRVTAFHTITATIVLRMK